MVEEGASEIHISSTGSLTLIFHMLQEASLPHALLLTSKPKAPLLWKVIANKFNKQIGFGASKDADGATAKALGIADATGKESRVLIWPAGATEPTVYQGGCIQ